MRLEELLELLNGLPKSALSAEVIVRIGATDAEEDFDEVYAVYQLGEVVIVIDHVNS